MKIELFSVPGCVACVSVRRSLEIIAQERSDIVVEEVDLSINPERGSRYAILACPALVINEKVEVIGAINVKRMRRLFSDIDAKVALRSRDLPLSSETLMEAER